MIELLQVINGLGGFLWGGDFVKSWFWGKFCGDWGCFAEKLSWGERGWIWGNWSKLDFGCFVAISLPIFGVSDPKSEQNSGVCFFCCIFWCYCCHWNEFGDWWDETWGHWDMRKMGFLNIAVCYPNFGVTNRGVLRGKMYQIAYKNWDVFVTSLLPDSQQTP
ncbi:MAG: hypothetical protein IJ635_06295 [Bacteroidaceae bacterium]|nr:hypothetical protein [Bacteroidaceae bacterium]